MLKRIEELHAEIKYRDTRIEELEQELKIKDEIIRKQVIMLSDYEKNEKMRREHERVKAESDLAQAEVNLRQIYADTFMQEQYNNLLKLA